jgi:branched-chain amino acid transport system permease protein
MNELAQVTMNGLVEGSIYAILALGFALSFGVLRKVNFAHGATCVVGGFTGYFLIVNLSLPVWIAIIGVLCAGALLGFAVEKVAFKPFRQSPPLFAIVSSLAVAMIIENVLAAVFGEQTRSLTPGIARRLVVPFFGVTLTTVQLLIISVALLVAGLMYLVVARTDLGRQAIAVADDAEAAMTWGIDGPKIVSAAFMLSSSVAAVAGCLVSFDLGIDSHMGTGMLFRAFTANVIFGVGSLPGALLGGLLLGITENFVAAFVSSQYKSACTFVVLIIVLLVKPHGILNLQNRRFS